VLDDLIAALGLGRERQAQARSPRYEARRFRAPIPLLPESDEVLRRTLGELHHGDPSSSEVMPAMGAGSQKY
jgi:hypothetical protein